MRARLLHRPQPSVLEMAKDRSKPGDRRRGARLRPVNRSIHLRHPGRPEPAGEERWTVRGARSEARRRHPLTGQPGRRRRPGSRSSCSPDPRSTGQRPGESGGPSCHGRGVSRSPSSHESCSPVAPVALQVQRAGSPAPPGSQPLFQQVTSTSSRVRPHHSEPVGAAPQIGQSRRLHGLAVPRDSPPGRIPSATPGQPGRRPAGCRLSSAIPTQI